jgi:drug/metabolite transporter (DMT)-like permease
MSTVNDHTLPTATPDRTALAIALIVGSMLLLSAMDAAMKGMTDEVSLWQICAARSVFAVPILIAIVAGWSIDGLRQIFRPWVMLRCLLFVGMWISYYAALPYMDLSVAATALYTIPLFIAGFASAFAREPVGLRRWTGIAIGFAGVVVILRPGSDAFSAATLLPVLAAICYALAAIVTRMRCATESAFVLALGLHVSLLVTGIVGAVAVALFAPDTSRGFLLGPWQPMDLRDWAVMGAFGIAMVAIAAGVAKAYQVGSPAVVGTFDYSYLAFASLWGALFFSEALDTLTVTGILLITGAGLLVLWRPRRRGAVAPAA